ncbi:mitochondrial carrier homolog 2 isoform X2 [Alligator sinensis]|uniref:Mitochondrial carrier homolog 2 isoform X2 n=1 Tax=Alligator sinensis TaxID=38654 RepID=A0A3Q0FKM6_ALLSI|nr:mitochondrial carrier homolog 2 isoform X2 [Alligator sinensis]
MADTASQVLLGSGLTVLSQPLMYVKVLVQVGYEPLPPTLGRNIFGRQVYQLPGLFAYAKHIMKIDGRAGLFKGLTPRLCSGVVGTVVHSKVLQRYQEADQTEPGASQKEPTSSLEQVIKETSREMVARSAATLVTHPFHVITLRCMVQFIGRETKYSGTGSSFITIYREEGILGFFAGLIPRLLGDIISLWLCNMLAYLINTYALENGVSTMAEMKSYSQAVTGAGRGPHPLCTHLLFLAGLLEPASQGGQHEPREQPILPEDSYREAVHVGGEEVSLRQS